MKLLLLDLNGTLVHDWGASHAGVCACFRSAGIPVPTLVEYIRGVAGDGDYKKFYEDRGFVADREVLYETFLPGYVAHTANFTNVELFAGVLGTLRVLRDRAVEIHVVTAARTDLAMRLVEVTGIQRFCANFHCHVHNKEAQIHAIIDGMDIDPADCAMMGDLPSDVIHAKRAGIRAVGFANPDVPRDLFSGVDMDYMALSFSGILDW